MTNRPMNIKIEFAVEPADTSVGIMAEGFAAWNINGTCWCNLDMFDAVFEHCKFSWYLNTTGEEVDPRAMIPNDKFIVEHALYGFVNGYYAMQEDIAESMDKGDGE